MDFETIKETFSNPQLVSDYKQAADTIGLWRSEQALAEEYFLPSDRLLVTGAGAGRVAFGLWDLGFRNIHAIDLSQKMAEAFHEINNTRNTSIQFEVANAVELPFENNTFDGIFMPYNVLMHIPKHSNRMQALHEARRVLNKGKKLIFSTHEDREAPSRFRHFWKDEKKQWENGTYDKRKDEFGDVIVYDRSAFIYMHIPTLEEITGALNETGFHVVKTALREEIARETREVIQFSMECRFWVGEAV